MEYEKLKTVQKKESAATAVGKQSIELKDNRSQSILQRKPNKTGLPDNLKSGIENLSGHSMDDVKVHYNSSKPAQLNAHAYAQGTQIHLGSGQEKHLPHEAWHVVQQKQGRVQSTKNINGTQINDNAGLEKEADVMGDKAINKIQKFRPKLIKASTSNTMQRFGDKVALEFEEIDGEVKPIQDGLKNIYNRYRQENKTKRNTIEANYLEGSKSLLDRQNYLSFQLRAQLYGFANKKNPDLKFDDAYSKNEAAKIDISGREKIKLNAKAVHLRDIHFKEIKPMMSEMAIDFESQRIYEQRKVDIQEWQKGPKKNKKPKSKTENQAEKDAKSNIKSKINGLAKAVAFHHLGDELVQNYESGYMTSSFRKNELFRIWKKYTKKKGYFFIADFMKKDDIIDLYISKRRTERGKMLKIATIYENDKRFIETGSHEINDALQEPEVRKVFTHRENGQEYVKDAHDTFVRRYVSRALNKYDVNIKNGIANVNIGADPRKKEGDGRYWEEIAEELATKNDKEKNMQEVFKHQRQKEAQGGSPFISLTTTKRDIFGSTGMNFEGEHGKAEIDLAKISKNRIIDTHTPEAYHQITGIRRPNPFMSFSEDDIVERNSAARDAMRTRELVILGNKGIPQEAVSGYRRKDNGRSEGSKIVDYTKSGGKFYDASALSNKNRKAKPLTYQKWKGKNNWQKLLNLGMITKEEAETMKMENNIRRRKKKKDSRVNRHLRERPDYTG